MSNEYVPNFGEEDEPREVELASHVEHDETAFEKNAVPQHDFVEEEDVDPFDDEPEPVVNEPPAPPSNSGRQDGPVEKKRAQKPLIAEMGIKMPNTDPKGTEMNKKYLKIAFVIFVLMASAGYYYFFIHKPEQERKAELMLRQMQQSMVVQKQQQQVNPMSGFQGFQQNNPSAKPPKAAEVIPPPRPSENVLQIQAAQPTSGPESRVLPQQSEWAIKNKENIAELAKKLKALKDSIDPRFKELHNRIALVEQKVARGEVTTTKQAMAAIEQNHSAEETDLRAINEELLAQLNEKKALIETLQREVKDLKGKNTYLRELERKWRYKVKELGKSKATSPTANISGPFGGWQIAAMSPGMIILVDENRQHTKVLREGETWNGNTIKQIDMKSGQVITSKGVVKYKG